MVPRDHWKRVKQIVIECERLPEEKRPDFLVQACAGNPELRTEVDQLLGAPDPDTSELLFRMPPVLKNGELVDLRIGPYRLERELGRGGMGTVYLAHRQDDELAMTVTVKLIQHQLASPLVLKRFRLERQVLADLKHPHIAMLLDAGTTDDGRPYFIMEYMEGLNIDAWCAANAPDLGRLLSIFRAAVTAVGFAHNKGVIHRDIKPGNLMVTPDGQAKLLDFGIAYLVALNDEDALTATGFSPMTPEYASPEQRRGDELTAASDIYPLGLLLLHLLTGLRPSRLGKPLEAVTNLMANGRRRCFIEDQQVGITHVTTLVASEQEASGDEAQIHSSPPDSEREPIPEALGHVLRRALAHKTRFRYATSDELAADLNRVLAALPRAVLATTEKTYDVLPWYHRDDRKAVETLVRLLEKELTVWPGVGRVEAGEEIGQALAETRACLVCLGPGGQGPWLADAATRDSLAFRAEDLNILPVLLRGAPFPDRQSKLPSFLRGRAWIRFDDEAHGLMAAIRRLEAKTEAPLAETGLCPFRGLEVFREQDQALFFGREAITQRIAEHLAQNRFVAVLGPSGSGKSSVVQAGVLPHLREAGFVPVLFTPTEQPLQALACALRAAFVAAGKNPPTEVLLNRLRGSSQALHFIADELFEEAEQDRQERLCLVIDQFEEVFTLAQDKTDRDRLVTSLVHALDQARGKISLLITMRSDFLGADLDLPLEMMGLQAQVITQTKFNPISRTITPIKGEESCQVWEHYLKAARDHYAVCDYPQFNLFRKRFPTLAAKVNRTH